MVIETLSCFLYMRKFIMAKIYYKVGQIINGINQVFMLSSTKILFGVDNHPSKMLHVSLREFNEGWGYVDVNDLNLFTIHSK
jgi:hypothetical protein